MKARIVLACAALLCAALRPAVAADLLVRDVTLVDGTGAAPVPETTVLVRDGRIAAIAQGKAAGRKLAATARRAEVVDGRGRFLAPGLIDTHIHLQGGRIPDGQGGNRVDRELALRTLHGYLYSGVTAIYDAGNNADFIFGLRQEERDGAIVAPRIFASGANITVPGGYADNPFSLKVSELPRDQAKLDAQFDRKPDVQKLLYDNLGTFGTPMAPVFSDEVLKGIIATAHARGIRTTVHAITELASRKLLDAGIDSFAHPVRAAATPEFIQRLATQRVPVATTLVVLQHIARVVDDPSFLDAPLFRATVDAGQLEREKGPARMRYVENGMAPQFKLVVPHVAKTLRRMHEGGVLLALGTDRTWGASVHMELALLASEAQIPPAALVRIAALNGATWLGRERELGSIEPGKLADLLLLREDPTRDVAAWQAIDAVYKGGQRIDLKKLDVPANRGTLTR